MAKIWVRFLVGVTADGRHWDFGDTAELPAGEAAICIGANRAVLATDVEIIAARGVAADVDQGTGGGVGVDEKQITIAEAPRRRGRPPVA